MFTRFATVLFAAPLLALAASAADVSSSPAASPNAMTENPLLQESSLDFHYPPFDKIKDEDFAPAFEQGMADQLKEIEPIARIRRRRPLRIRSSRWRKPGELLGRVDRIFSNLAGANTNPALQKIETRHGAETLRASGCDFSERAALRADRDDL